VKTVIAAIIVSVIVSSSATAGVTTLITSKQIKDHTIQLQDISSAAASQLKGQTGAKGDTGTASTPGPRGEKGDTGATGAPGPQGPKGDQGQKGDPGASNGLYVRTDSSTAVADGNSGGTPAVIDLKCEPGDISVAAPTWFTDPPESDWPSGTWLQVVPGSAIDTPNEYARSYTMHGAEAGTQTTFTQSVVCSHSE